MFNEGNGEKRIFTNRKPFLLKWNVSRLVPFLFVVMATDPHDRGMQFCGSVAARKRKKRSASLAAGSRFRCAASIKAGCAH